MCDNKAGIQLLKIFSSYCWTLKNTSDQVIKRSTLHVVQGFHLNLKKINNIENPYLHEIFKCPTKRFLIKFLK